MVQAAQKEIEVPETWDTIKYTNPLYPTTSRGKFGKALYVNNKYHCYSVQHSKPKFELMPYRATGFGFAERNMNYIPLTHVQDRSKPKPPEFKYDKPEIQKIYEAGIDAVKLKLSAELRNDHQQKCETTVKETRNFERNQTQLVHKMQHDIETLRMKTDNMIRRNRHRWYRVHRVL